MNKNQTTQQTKSDPKGKAIASLVLGIISVGIAWIWLLPSSLLQTFIGDSQNLFVYFISSFILSFTGLILGKKGVRSTKKKLAVGGIVLCIIGLLTTTFYFLFIISMASSF